MKGLKTSMKKVLSIAGSDCTGGAGIQADLKTFSAHGVFGMSVIVSVVAENTMRVIDIQDVSPDMIGKQIDAVFEDMGADAVKIGMLSSPDCMRAVADRLERYRPENVVVDPVMFAKNGSPLMAPDSTETLIRLILPLADVLTPNVPEAEKIAGFSIRTPEDMERAAVEIYKMGCRSVVVKGGNSIPESEDVLYDGTGFTRLCTEHFDTKHTHGTGCTFSSAIASNLALGLPLGEAVQKAKTYVTEAIRHAPGIGRGNGPTNHFYAMYRQDHENQ